MKFLFSVCALWFIPACVFAQNPPANPPTTTTDPTGKSCTADSVLNYVPSGKLFTCQSGVYAAAGSTGTVTSATIAPGVGIGTSGTCTITSTGTCTISSNALTRECVFPTGGGTCLVTHNLGTTSPVVSIITNSGGCSTETIATFTANTFTVTNNVAQDCTYSISYAPSNVASFGISAAVINSTAARGGTGATYTITATPGSGYSGTITASAGSFVTVGAGVTCPNVTLTSGGSWTGTMTCTASGGAFKGTGTFIVSATDSLTTQVTPTVALTVYDGVAISAHLTDTGSCAGSNISTCTTTAMSTTATDAVFLKMDYCSNAGCSSPCYTTGTVTDGGDSFTVLAAANITNVAWCSLTFQAKNVAGGSKTFTIALSGNTYYMQTAAVSASKASVTAPIDTSVTNTLHTTGTTLNLASAGNVTNVGEVIVVMADTNNTVTVTGAFSQIASSQISTLVNPATGAGVSYAATQNATGVSNVVMIGVTP